MKKNVMKNSHSIREEVTPIEVIKMDLTMLVFPPAEEVLTPRKRVCKRDPDYYYY